MISRMYTRDVYMCKKTTLPNYCPWSKCIPMAEQRTRAVLYNFMTCNMRKTTGGGHIF